MSIRDQKSCNLEYTNPTQAYILTSFKFSYVKNGKDSMYPAVKTVPAGTQIGCPPAEKMAPRAESPSLRQTPSPFPCSFRKHLASCRVHKITLQNKSLLVREFHDQSLWASESVREFRDQSLWALVHKIRNHSFSWATVHEYVTTILWATVRKFHDQFLWASVHGFHNNAVASSVLEHHNHSLGCRVLEFHNQPLWASVLGFHNNAVASSVLEIHNKYLSASVRRFRGGSLGFDSRVPQRCCRI
jgi:hypothetical protein